MGSEQVVERGKAIACKMGQSLAEGEPMSRRRGVVAPVMVWTLAALMATGVWAVRVPGARFLADDPVVGSGALATVSVAPEPTPVLPELPEGTGRPADAAVLAARLDAVPRDGVTDVVGIVSDARTGETLYRTGLGARTPASSMKVLTSVVALDTLGADRTFTTTTWRTPDGALVLRGGGDPLLAGDRPTGYPADASLQELAARTAERLRSDGVAQVSLAFDASLFPGPAWHPEWSDIFRYSVAPVSALTVDHAHVDPRTGERSPDPARLAAERFAAYLGAEGIAAAVAGPAVTPADAVRLAGVDSPPVSTIVEQLLASSDNDAAETLARHVALARGRPATPGDAASAIAEGLQSLGLWSEGMLVGDGNGISGNNTVTADALAGAVALGVRDDRFRAVITGLPVAGVTGTLNDRFTDPASQAARGVVRAKTGTIRGVNSLTGYVVTRDGRPLVFAFMLSGGAGQSSARLWLDRATAAVADCGC